MVQINPGRPSDLEAIRQLLIQANLVVDDLTVASMPHFLVGRHDHYDNQIVATAAVELLGNGVGLLRSVVINPEFRGQGLGQQIVEQTLQQFNVQQVYLLTTTAEGFFM